MNQASLRKMANDRLKDATALLKGKRWTFAYYVTGYAVECGLKSCLLARMVHTGWVFNEDNKKIDECRTHDFEKLIQIADLRNDLNASLKESSMSGSKFARNWDVAGKWSVTSRYEDRTEQEARELHEAITDKTDGVMKWIRRYW